MQTCSLALAQVHPYIHLPCTHITINNLFLKEEMKRVEHSLMGSLVYSFNHFSQQIYMSSTICWLDVAINKNVKMYAFKETLFYWEDSKNTVTHKCVIH